MQRLRQRQQLELERVDDSYGWDAAAVDGGTAVDVAMMVRFGIDVDVKRRAAKAASSALLDSRLRGWCKLSVISVVKVRGSHPWYFRQ